MPADPRFQSGADTPHSKLFFLRLQPHDLFFQSCEHSAFGHIDGSWGKADATAHLGGRQTIDCCLPEGFPRLLLELGLNRLHGLCGELSLKLAFPILFERVEPRALASTTTKFSLGYFVRVRVPIGFAHKALLVNERAIDTDQGQKVLYIVNEKNEVTVDQVRLGAPHDGLRAIEDGVKPDERVIVIGLQQVRPGATVDPKLADMPNGVVAHNSSPVAGALAR